MNKSPDPTFETRKLDHLRLSLDNSNQVIGLSGLDKLRLVHNGLPELDFSEVALNSKRLGQKSDTPFYVAGMTAGHPQAADLNYLMASVCERRGWAFGVGSQRRELEESGTTVDNWKRLRDDFPDLEIIGNIGATQLVRTASRRIETMTQNLGIQALAVHLNPLQECIQTEGTPHFRGVTQAIRSLISDTALKVVVKETGCGLAPVALKRLAELNVSAVDVSGLGGTHWGRIEGARASQESTNARAAEVFRDWGYPTATSVHQAARLMPRGTEVWASGGVRSGLDAAKLIALGASQVGFAKPALEASMEGEEALDAWMGQIEFELRIALFCTGYMTPMTLQESPDQTWDQL
ncbi:type 2 isopentenyl-diphosphate Delta-isomerase [Streptomyces chryseus]